MKKIIIAALSIVVLASLASGVNAETTHSEKEPATTSKSSEITKKQTADTQKSEKQTGDAASQVGSEKDGVQGRGLPKAFSGSDDGQ